jgi:hypothetical protein
MWGTVLLLHQSPRLVLTFGDNEAYINVANAILHWNFHSVPIQQFMGYSYFIAAVSLLLHVPAAFALWLVAIVSALVSTWLAAQLFGSVVATYFAVANFAWLQAAFGGGSEPLAVALGLGALLAFRRKRIFAASLLGSLSVTVRPLMVFVLLGIGLVLLYRKQIVGFLIAFGTSLAIGLLYTLPLAKYFGDPFLTIHTYSERDYGAAKVVGPHGHLFGFPFHGIIAGTLAYHAPWTNLLLSFFWIALVLTGICLMFSARFRTYAREHPNEAIFCGLYLLAVFSYDYLLWARSHFMRFSIPALPFVFYALLPYLPKDRRLLWGIAAISAVLAALSVVGIQNVIGVS